MDILNKALEATPLGDIMTADQARDILGPAEYAGRGMAIDQMGKTIAQLPRMRRVLIVHVLGELLNHGYEGARLVRYAVGRHVPPGESWLQFDLPPDLWRVVDAFRKGEPGSISPMVAAIQLAGRPMDLLAELVAAPHAQDVIVGLRWAGWKIPQSIAETELFFDYSRSLR